MVKLSVDSKMTTNIDKLVDDAKKMALRLRDRIVLGGLTNNSYSNVALKFQSSNFCS